MPAYKQLKITPMQLYSWANEHVTGIKVMFVSKQDIAEHSLKIEPRLQNAKTVVGTKSYHRFVPLADNKLRMHHLSVDQIGTVVQVGVHASSVSINFPTQMELKPWMYVAVVYDNKWYVGCIADWSEQFEVNLHASVQYKEQFFLAN